MAAFLSFLCPGLGHLILGKPVQAFIWAVGFAIACGSAVVTLGIGTPIPIIVYIMCIMSAAKAQRKQLVADIARGMRKSGR